MASFLSLQQFKIQNLLKSTQYKKVASNALQFTYYDLKSCMQNETSPPPKETISIRGGAAGRFIEN